MTIDFFTKLFDLILNGVLVTLGNKTAAIISLISPVIGICFTIYLMLIAAQAMKSNVGTENIMDLFLRCIAWTAIIYFGMNINTYQGFVVPFFNGLGADLSTAMIGSDPGTSGAVLDALANKYITTSAAIYANASGVGETIAACVNILFLLVGGALFLSVAAAYILLAQIALGVLLVIGPIFIALALFPATRKFFDAWVGQCVNYVILTVLFNYLGHIEADFITNTIFSYNQYGGMIASFAAAVVFLLIAFNLPSLASALSGGVGISTMVGKPLQVAQTLKNLMSKNKTPPPPPPGGGAISPK
jgi:type IV secretion system protein VirB6